MTPAPPHVRRPRRRLDPTLSLASLLLACGLAIAAPALVPDPIEGFSDKADAVLYINAQAVAQSPVSKTLAPLLQDLPAQLSSLPGSQDLNFDNDLAQALLKAVGDLNLAEVVAISEAQAGQTKDTDSLLVLAKLDQTVEDQETLIGQLLDLAEQQQPGLKDQILASRSREGAADFFDVPAEALGDKKPPFPVSLAIGPGKGGSVLGFGRTDTLKAFLAGQSRGRLSSRAETVLPAKGQIWLYAQLPPGIADSMGAGLPSGGPQAPPMMAGLSQSLKEIKDFGLSISMGSTSLDLGVSLGCTSTKAASDMAQAVQGFQGMATMMASQNPSGTPSALRNLKIASSGDVFRLNTSITLADLRKGLQNARQQAGIAGGSSQSPPIEYVIPEVKPLDDDAEPEVAVEFLSLLPDTGGHVRRGKLKIQNHESKPIETLRITYTYLDDRGTKLGQWTRLQQDVSPTLVPANSTRELQVPLFNLPTRTAQVTASLQGVAFSDGTQWP